MLSSATQVDFMSSTKIFLSLCLLVCTIAFPGCAEEGNKVNEAPDTAAQEAQMLNLSNDLNQSLEMKPGEE